jgi:hypothetical protein
MATERYSLDFISIGCNKQANCVSWGRNNTIAYAAGKFVALYNPVVRILFISLVLWSAKLFKIAEPQKPDGKHHFSRLPS